MKSSRIGQIAILLAHGLLSSVVLAADGDAPERINLCPASSQMAWLQESERDYSRHLIYMNHYEVWREPGLSHFGKPVYGGCRLENGSELLIKMPKGLTDCLPGKGRLSCEISAEAANAVEAATTCYSETIEFILSDVGEGSGRIANGDPELLDNAYIMAMLVRGGPRGIMADAKAYCSQFAASVTEEWYSAIEAGVWEKLRPLEKGMLQICHEELHSDALRTNTSKLCNDYENKLNQISGAAQ